MKTRTNHIRWSKEMERKCLGSIWPAYPRKNGSKENVLNTASKVEEDKSNDEIVLEDGICNNLENNDIGPSCNKNDISLAISENIQENAEDISENSKNVNLKTFMENAIKENEIHKTKINESSKKIRWNEDMLKRCLGAYFGGSQDTRKQKKKSGKKDDELSDKSVLKEDNESIENDNESIDSELSQDIIPQDDYMADALLYNGEIGEELKNESYIDFKNDKETKKTEKRKERKRRTRRKSTYMEPYTNDEYDDSHYEVSLQDLFAKKNQVLEEKFISKESDKSGEQGNMGNFEKISWSIINESYNENSSNESDLDGEDTEKINEDNNNYHIEESQCDTDNYQNKEEIEVQEENTYEADAIPMESDIYSYNESQDSNNIDEENYEENKTKDEYYIQEDFYSDEYTYADNEEDKIFDFEDIGSAETSDLDIANETIDSMDWDNNWDEYNLMDSDTQEIETVESFNDYGSSFIEDNDFNFTYEPVMESQEYAGNFENSGLGQTVECRIVT
jgi:hypothetical protein